MDFTIEVAGPAHYPYAEEICRLIEEAAKARGTGIAKRSPDYVRSKMEEGKAIIALRGEELAGFCYIETWSHNKYVANSGLIVAAPFRNQGLAKRIKQRAFELSRKKYPEAKLFGITTSLAVMKINSELGYKPVTFSELTTDDVFWTGCQSCPNYDILSRTNRKMCLCTGMLYDPAWENKREEKEEHDTPLRRQLRNKLVAYRFIQERLHAFLIAANRHEIDRALSYVTDDFRLVQEPSGTVLDREQFRGLLEWQAALNSRLTHEEIHIEDDRILGVLSERNDLLDLLGLAALETRVISCFGPNGNIREQQEEPLHDQPTLEELLQPALEWAAERYPERLAEVFPDGRLVFSRAAAAQWMSLVRTWREESRVDV